MNTMERKQQARGALVSRRIVTLVVSSALTLVSLVLSSPPAHAAGCTGSKTQSSVLNGVIVNCDAGTKGSNGLPAATPGIYKQGKQYPAMQCNYRRNPAWPSNYGVLLRLEGRQWNYITEQGAPRDADGAPLHCMRPSANGQNQTEKVSMYVPQPVITSDYPDRFLFNAPTTLSIDVNAANKGQDGAIQKEIPGFSGIVSFVPIKVVWNFGDGTTGEGMKVQHTFLTAKDGKVHVTATVTWRAVLSLPGERGANARDLGELQAVGQLDHDIVQIQATPMEPSSEQ